MEVSFFVRERESVPFQIEPIVGPTRGLFEPQILPLKVSNYDAQVEPAFWAGSFG